MKRFLIKTIAFFVVIAVADIVAGIGLDWLTTQARAGFTRRDNYICDSLRTDILLSGSSRCVRHYNPQIISELCGSSCYNSGQMGNGIILNYGRLLMINERSKPKLVIYDVTPKFDYLEGEDNHRYLTWLKGHYDRAGVADIFASVDNTEKYKMVSQLYRYNSRIFEILADVLSPMSSINSDGFSPLKGKMDKLKIKEKKHEKEKYIVDSIKMKYLQEYINLVGSHNIVFVVSPIWYGMDTMQLRPLKELCEEKGIILIDFSNDPKYVHKDEFFKNGSHMNAKGADEFTRDFTEKLMHNPRIKQLMLNK